MKKALIIFGVIVATGVLLWFGLISQFANNLGGGGQQLNVPDVITAGEPTDIQLIVTATGGGGPIQGRYTEMFFHYRLVGESEYRTLRPESILLPENFKAVQSKTFQSEAYQYVIPSFPVGTIGEVEYYSELTFDGYPSRQEGLKRIQIVSSSDQLLMGQTNISLSDNRKEILVNGATALAIDDDAILSFFRTRSQLCNDSNRDTTPERKNFCEDKRVFRNETSFQSIAVSLDGKTISFTVESTALAPDTVVGILYPNRTNNRIIILTNYYLGNEFISFSPTGVSFVYKGGCWENICAFYIKDTETLADRIDFIPKEADVRPNYEFVRWITDDEIEYREGGVLKKATLSPTTKMSTEKLL